MNDIKHFAIVLLNSIVGITLMYAAFKTGSPIFYVGFIGWATATYFLGMELDNNLSKTKNK